MSGGGLSSLSFLDRDDGRQLDGATQAGDPAAAKPKRAESLRERAGRTLRDAKRQWKAVYNDEGAYVGGAGALDPTRQGGGGGPVDEVAEARRLLNEQNDVELAQLGRERDRLAAQADLDDELDDFLGFGGPANAARGGGGDQSDGMQTVVLVLFAVFMCVLRSTSVPADCAGPTSSCADASPTRPSGEDGPRSASARVEPAVRRRRSRPRRQLYRRRRAWTSLYIAH